MCQNVKLFIQGSIFGQFKCTLAHFFDSFEANQCVNSEGTFNILVLVVLSFYIYTEYCIT